MTTTPTPNTRQGPRVFLAIMTVLTFLLGTQTFMRAVGSDGWDPLDVMLVVVFVALFTWVAFSFWAAVMGAWVALLERPSPVSKLERMKKRAPGPLPRTVLLAPVYNEDPTEVFAGLQATCESLRAAGLADSFDLFILSDTRAPRVWLEEELAWAGLASVFTGSGLRVFYRRRTLNEGKKSGNIAEFCRRWGGNYKYMIVLDADSVMSGATVAELVRRMEERPDVGIMQAPPLPVGRESLFARMQQFASSGYGDIYAAGLACWSQFDANYYGHNAIIRVQAFMENCALRKLPGKPPLGGDIMSHDFVEAALMRRAGWRVVLADDLTGSYEQCPPTLIDFAKRDQRWCLGNLQHLRILLRHGLHPVSRIHLFGGAMSYLCSALWLLFIALGVVQEFLHRRGALLPHHINPVFSRGPVIVLLICTMGMLIVPKVLAWFALDRDPFRLIGHGSHFEAGASAFFETLISTLIAPVMMIYHTLFIVGTFTGHKVHWGPQQRTEVGTHFREAAENLWFHTALGVFGLAFVHHYTPSLFWWVLPVGLGLVLSIPTAMVLSSVRLGRAFRVENLFITPEEKDVPPILRRREQLLERFAARKGPGTDPVGRVILIPAVNSLHITVQRASLGVSDPRDQSDPARSAAAAAPEPPLPASPAELDAMSPADLVKLLSCEAAMRKLHRLAWTTWPLDEIVRRS